jgi:LuxR family maltose regulon positive regulatory protein
LALDALDTDPQRFISYVIAALAERFPNFGARTRSVLTNLTSFDSGLEPVLVTLVNEIHDEIAEHFVLVLDDFHFLDEASVIQSFITRFARLMHENCHLILCSRTLPELPDLPLLVARDEVGGLDFADLAFRAEEIQALLAQNQELNLSDDEARRLEEATEGWITGIQFADVNSLRAGRSPFHTTRVMGVSVFDYLGSRCSISCHMTCRLISYAPRCWMNLTLSCARQSLLRCTPSTGTTRSCWVLCATRTSSPCRWVPTGSG